MTTREQLLRRLNIVAKWRALFAGWQLGTRADTDPEAQAVRNLNEARLLLRVEVTALTGLLIKKGLITEQEWIEALYDEAIKYNDDLEEKFPGVRATEQGLSFDASRVSEIQKWMGHWKP